jgi:hypothetical protein
VPSHRADTLTSRRRSSQSTVAAPRRASSAAKAPLARTAGAVMPQRISPLSPLTPTEPPARRFAVDLLDEPFPLAPAIAAPVRQQPVERPADRRPQAKAAAAAPMTRAALRAAEGPLTSRSSRRAAERSAAKPSLTIPQVGIASALGLATIAAPLTGALAVPAPKAAVQALPAIAVAQPAVAFPRVEAARPNAVEDAKLVGGADESSAVPKTLAAPRSIIVTRASRNSRERSVLPGCTGVVPAGAAWANGLIPTKGLCTLWEPKHSLRADAAVAIAKLNIAYKQRFGKAICLTDTYRSLADQRRLKALKPGLAAVAGTSQHGWGLAVDLCGGVDNYGSTAYRWLRANGPAYGWDNPDWALPGGSGPTEPWHWEYLPGEKVGPGSD